MKDYLSHIKARFRDKRQILAGITAVLLVYVILYLIQGYAFNPLWMLWWFAASQVVAGSADYMLTKRKKALEQRAHSTDGVVWQVQVNGMTVGEISDADYASIQRAVYFRPRVYWTQFVNIVNVGLRVADYLFMAIPLSVFWAGLGCFVFAPDLFAEVLSSIQTITPAQVVEAIPLLLNVLAVVTAMVVAIHVVIGRRFGFVNQFDRACGYMVRRAVGCAAEGDVLLFRFTQGAMVTPGALAGVRGKR